MSNFKDNPYFQLFFKQKENQYNIGNSSYSKRIKKLNTLQRAIEITYRQQIKEALYKDLKRPLVESDLVAIYLVIKEIKHAKANLHRWLKNKKAKTDIVLLGTKSWVKYEPKGVCLIISPWNYPINLTFSPLVAAIAAGNTVIIKPSEISKHCSEIMQTMIKDLFEDNEVALVQGDADVARNLLELPFNHIFFTGSIPVGKLVMKAAAKNLSSVTLELGGKSPVIIDKSVDMKLAARTVAWLKHFNCGQTCIAPDYIFIHDSVLDLFINHYKYYLNKFYSKDASNSNSYGRIINEKHFSRLISYVDDAKTNGAKFIVEGKIKSEERFIGPTVISNLEQESLLMQEEIFGPILPLKTYKTKEQVIEYLKDKDKPLALYVYSKSKSFINYIVANTRAGTTCINANGIQFSNHNLPFGGSNSSGIGKAHGFYSFKAFSNERAVLRRYALGPIALLFPPYTDLKEKLAKFTVKWF
ncbi:aldehyde dehydrogenase family protein [uncultured Winogradskyella sp.]|uniref:aldehyde dehydrogenase family protein n=1 Tax=uncultured Winogradskyella sp. TaxID=395353 RepID=UPI00261B8A6D|nr:aldehyde dehydrogenase family protein [uncultured Winogradskyella sp.]